LSERKLRLAVVGLGKMGLVHAGILNVLPNVELVAFCEKSNLIRRLSSKLFTSLETVDDLEKLAGLNLDAAYITTPIPTHFSIAKTLLEKKIAENLFVEKTLAQTYKESKSLVDLACAHQSVTMVGYLRRFYVTFNKARELLQEDAIGRIESFMAYAYSSDFIGLEKETKTSNSRGGVLRDLGCHAIDLALWLFGDLEVESSQKPPWRTDAAVSFGVESSQMTGVFDISWYKKDYRMPEVGFSIIGSKGKLFVNDDQIKLEIANGKGSRLYRHDLNDTVPFWLGLPEYYREDLHFVNDVVSRSKAESDFSSAARVDKIIDNVVGRQVGEQ
jgi:predicted dehydrogenase